MHMQMHMHNMTTSEAARGRMAGRAGAPQSPESTVGGRNWQIAGEV